MDPRKNWASALPCTACADASNRVFRNLLEKLGPVHASSTIESDDPKHSFFSNSLCDNCCAVAPSSHSHVPRRTLCCWHTAFGRGHRRSSQIFVRHYSLQLPQLRVGRRDGRREGPRCGRTSFEGLRVWPERTGSTQRLALFPGRNRSASGDERG